MNQLVNIIYLFTSLYFLLPQVSNITNEPIYLKLLVVILSLGLEVVFDCINRFIRKEKIKFSDVLDKSLMHSLLVLLGFLLFNDIKDSPNLINKVPGLSQIIDVETTKILIMVVPIIAFTTSKCFLKAY
tara:strand:- start:363 stop:749 length:387 start_codon:yes stop_codon:yes gene_type:complete